MKKSFFFLILIAALAVSCSQPATDKIDSSVVNNPNTANGGNNSDRLPVFSFEKTEHDFGKLTQGEKVSFVFKFTNSGKSDLVISDAKSTCGCTVPDYPKGPVKPGGTGEITVSFNTEGKKGIVTKTITLMANTQPNTKVLTIKAEIVMP